MIYGINFNGVPIPPAIKSKFAAALDSKFRRVSANRGCTWLLVGVATTPEDRDRMISQATNGHRKLHVIERPTAGAPFFGIYSSYSS